MTTYEFGDVLLVPFPFTDQTGTKKRPAVVISSAAYQQVHADIIIMAITSQLKTVTLPDNLVIADWASAGLLKPSVIKPVLSTLEKGLVLRKLGRLSTGDRQALHLLIQSILRE